MEPDSVTLVVLLLLTAGGLLVYVARRRPGRRSAVQRVVAGGLALVLAAGAGVGIVNDYYGYYQSWTQLSADLTGSYSGFATTTTSRTITATAGGRLAVETFAGARSGINRSGLVYLPPQYNEPAYAHTRFPVLELLHGTPGRPTDWVVHLGIVGILDRLIADHLMGPTIVVMPTISVGTAYQECVDAPRAADDTYITRDVRADVLARYRASTVPAEWGVAGYSSGGYCAANLALRHRSAFGAAGIMDGYFRPSDGPAAVALHFDPAAEAANNPLLLGGALSPTTQPLPAFWVSAGSGDRADIAAARAFTTALHGVEQVTLFREPGAGHNFYAWRPAIPRMLAWMWTQLAPPSLRVQFPIAGPVRSSSFPAPGAKPKHHRHRKHHRPLHQALHHALHRAVHVLPSSVPGKRLAAARPHVRRIMNR